MRLSDEVCSQARALVASRLGLDFPERRRPDLERGLIQVVGSASEHGIADYLTRLADLPESSLELMHLAQHLIVGETYFFRDPACFGALERNILPALIATRRRERVLRLRIWSAGCATGEEPYSIAMLLDRLLPDRSEWAVTILATDINPDALEIAQRARYREWSFRGTPRWAVDRYFHREANGAFDLDLDVRSMVTFAPLNLAAGGYPNALTNTAAMDLILCRNVLMYFTDDARRAAADRLQQALVANGWLAVSPVEAAPEVFKVLVPIALEGAGFFQKTSGAPSLDLPPVVADKWTARLGATASPHPNPLPEGEGAALGPLPLGEAGRRRVAPRTGEGWSGLVEQQTNSHGPSDHEDKCEAEVDSALTTTGLEEAVRLADEGSLDQARRLCEAAQAEDPLNPDVHLLLAMISQELGDIPAAIVALRRAIYLDQDSAPAHFLMGSLQMRQANEKHGRRSMQTVVSLLSAHPFEEQLAGSNGVTAGRLLETARAYLESTNA